MGRLAVRYADLTIQDMFPYNMKTQLTLAPSVSGQFFPSADLLNTQSLPFAVHRMIPRVIALDSNALPMSTQPDQELLMSLVELRMELQGLNQNMTKTPVSIDNLIKGSSERTWEFAEPFVLPNSYGLLVAADTAALPAGVSYTQLKIKLNFQGFLLQVAPPSEFR